MGWIGLVEELENVLRCYGAERDEEGRFLIFNGGIATFMGQGGPGAECVVDEESCCRIDGRVVRIAPLLASTSYGVQVHVV